MNTKSPVRTPLRAPLRAPVSLRAKGVQLLSQREHSVNEIKQKLLRHAQAIRTWAAASGHALDPLPHQAEPGQSPEPSQYHCAGGVAAAHSTELALAGLRPASTLLEGLDDPHAAVEKVLAWLQDQKYLSDERFLQSRIHLRASRFGNLRIKQELAQHRMDITPELNQALQASELERAMDVHRRKFQQTPPDTPAVAAKQARFLAQRGFSADVVRKVIRAAADPRTEDPD